MTDLGITSRPHPAARVAVVISVWVITFHWLSAYWGQLAHSIFRYSRFDPWYQLAQLVLAILLVACAPREFGLGIGRTFQKKQLVMIIAVPMTVICAVVMLFVRTPFFGEGWSIYLITPLVEELFFRGFIFSAISFAFPGSTTVAGFGIARATLFSAIAFGLWHLGGLHWPTESFIWFQLVYTTIAGLLWGHLRDQTGSIWSGCAIHAAINAWAVHVPGFWYSHP